MMMNIPNWVSVLLIVAWLALIHISSAADWSYSGELGPSTWKNRYPSCGGHRQSPINIHTTKVPTIPRDVPIKWKNYNKMPTSMTLNNTGHSLQLKATPSLKNQEPHLEIHSKTFVLDQTHFHWGEKDREGCEHTFNDKRYPLEMHAVHRRVVDGVEVNPPEVVVVTIVFEISNTKNPGLERFLHYVSRVMDAETEFEIPPFPADTLIPPFDTSYYLYEGSLTTPPCSEVVTFYIRKELANVASNQMELFRLARNEEKEEISGNFRPIQPINGRIVTYVH